MCKAEDAKPGAGRPDCTKVGIKSGKLLVMGEEAFIHYIGEGNCPKKCKVKNNTDITLA